MPHTSATRRTGSDPGTRARVIQATVDCILEEGYYRASSNRIAKRAGVTWGVIQHHFGTREALLVAVLKRNADELVELLDAAAIEGDSLEERITSYADVLWTHFRRPQYLVSAQIVLDLSHDPKAAAATAETIAGLAPRVADRWSDLLAEATGPEAARSPLGRALSESLRGLAIGLELTDAFGGRGRSHRRTSDRARGELVKAFTLLIEQSRS